MLLVGLRTPAAVHDERDADGRRLGCSPPQGPEQTWIEPGHAGNPVAEDGRAVRDGAVGRAERAAVPAAKVTQLAAHGVDG